MGTLVLRQPYRYHWYNEGERTAPAQNPNTSGAWEVFYGIHNFNITGREYGKLHITYRSFDECRAAIRDIADRLDESGHAIWYSYAVAPNSTGHYITAEVPYER